MTHSPGDISAQKASDSESWGSCSVFHCVHKSGLVLGQNRWQCLVLDAHLWIRIHYNILLTIKVDGSIWDDK